MIGKPEHPPDSPIGPLSIDQERLWFIEQLTPGTSAYNVSWAVVIEGELQESLFERALMTVVERHSVLRTTFSAGEPLIDRVRIRARRKVRPENEASGPVQIVHPRLEPAFIQEDLSSLPDPERMAAIRARVDQLASQPFDLEHGPLLRAALIRCGGRRQALLLCAHHLITDWVSFAYFRRELSDCYLHLVDERIPAVQQTAGEYLDFATWQRRLLESKRCEQQKAYWKRLLTDRTPTLALPTDRPRPPFRSMAGSRIYFDIPRHAGDALRSLATSHRATAFMGYLALFGALLHRYTGEVDIVIGTPVSIRWRPELRRMLGFLLNSIPIRIDFRGELSFDATLATVREAVLGALENADIPYGTLIDTLELDRDTSRNPIFQACLIYLEGDPDDGWFAGMQTERIEVNNSGSRFDLMLAIKDSGHGTRAYLEYPADLWEPESIAEVIEHFLRLLDGVVDQPAKSIRRHDLLSPERRRTLVAEWGRGLTLPFSTDTIHALFEKQAVQRPAKRAVVTEARSDEGRDSPPWLDQLTYSELNHRADQFAGVLRGHGVRPGDVVAVCLERSSLLLIAVLGIWKAGAAYVPLEPGVAPARSAGILLASCVNVVVVSNETRGGLPEGAWRKIDVGDRQSDLQSGDWPAAPSGQVLIPPDTLAYVMYTSGSTGKPKGVEVTHASVVNVIRSIAGETHFDSEDVWLSVTSPTFDISVLELFLPLAYGGSICLARRESLATRIGLVRLLSASGVTFMQATPSLFRIVLSTGWTGGSAIALLCGGEVLSPTLARELCAVSNRVWNLYGPTEATIWATAERLGAESISIGRPLANQNVYVLDRWMRLLPPGAVGEIFLGGAGVARGYSGAPALTAESFLPDPYCGQPGRRMYRTGDFGSFARNGSLQFVARRDDQVKLRGHRIELAEVEAVVGSFAALRDVTVMVRPARPTAGSALGDSLVAYAVPASATRPAFEDLTAFLQDKLPSWMLPSHLVLVDAMPLTASGKVDRRRLAELPIPTQEHADGFVPPRTRQERLLARIWAETLGVDPVGVSDNFFGLGGDSIQVVIVLARARESGIDISVAQLFLTPTVAELAKFAVAPSRRLFGTPPVAGSCELSTSARQMLDTTGDRFARKRALGLFQVPSWATPAQCSAAIAALFETHDALRAEVVRGEHGWMLNMPGPGRSQRSVHLAVRRFDSGDPASLARVAMRFARPSADEPSRRVCLLRTDSPGQAMLLFSLHPALVDRTSWTILNTDLEQAWRCLQDNTGIILAPATVSYKECCDHLHRAAPPVAGHGRAEPTRSQPGHFEQVELDRDLTAQLLADAASACKASTLEMIVAVIALLAGSECGQQPLRVNVDETDRSEGLPGLDVARTIGHLTRQRSVEFGSTANQRPAEVLKVVKAALRQRFADQLAPDHSGQALTIRVLASQEFLPSPPTIDVWRILLVEGGAGPCIIAKLQDERLHLLFLHRGQPRDTTLDRIRQEFAGACRLMAEDAKSNPSASLLPSDFPLASINPEQLKRIAAALRSH